MLVRSRTFVLFTTGSLLLIGIISAATGFGLAALSGEKKNTVQLSATQLSMLPLETDTSPGTPSPSMTGIPRTIITPESRTTSTAQPTLSVEATDSAPTEIIVRNGESLYPVCRRNCPGLWPLSSVPQSLVLYAQTVSQLNGIPWNNGHPLVYTDQRLDMPPCPNP